MPKKKTYAKKISFRKKGFLDLPFSWIFALIVGAIILFGAIYFATRASNVANTASSAQAGASLVNLLSPLENGVGSANMITITLPLNSRIDHQCSSFGNFGKDTLSVDQLINGKWGGTGVSISSQNKYIFSPVFFQGKTFNVFSEPFNLPFNVADLMYMTNAQTKYCFVNMPLSSETALMNLNQNNFEFSTCSGNATKICFNSNSNCDINVNTNAGTVEKSGSIMYFEGDALMYAAIFSDKSIYECELGRLMKRTSSLTDIYLEKATILQKEGCIPQTNFAGFQNSLNGYNSSEDIFTVSNYANQLENGGYQCNLW